MNGVIGVILVLVSAALTGAGCRRGAEPSAEQAVVSLFERAANARHCDELIDFLANERRAAVAGDVDACAHMLEFLHSHPLRRIRGVTDDGRAKHHRLVTVDLEASHVPRVLTLAKEENQWKITSL